MRRVAERSRGSGGWWCARCLSGQGRFSAGALPLCATERGRRPRHRLGRRPATRPDHGPADSPRRSRPGRARESARRRHVASPSPRRLLGRARDHTTGCSRAGGATRLRSRRAGQPSFRCRPLAVGTRGRGASRGYRCRTQLQNAGGLARPPGRAPGARGSPRSRRDHPHLARADVDRLLVPSHPSGSRAGAGRGLCATAGNWSRRSTGRRTALVPVLWARSCDGSADQASRDRRASASC